jgi:hypothetical protein
MIMPFSMNADGSLHLTALQTRLSGIIILNTLCTSCSIKKVIWETTQKSREFVPHLLR